MKCVAATGKIQMPRYTCSNPMSATITLSPHRLLARVQFAATATQEKFGRGKKESDEKTRRENGRSSTCVHTC